MRVYVVNVSLAIIVLVILLRFCFVTDYFTTYTHIYNMHLVETNTY